MASFRGSGTKCDHEEASYTPKNCKMSPTCINVGWTQRVLAHGGRNIMLELAELIDMNVLRDSRLVMVI